MNDGILALVTMNPTKAPSSGPTNSGVMRPSAITHQGCPSALDAGIHRTMIQPATAADNPTTEPTETSNSPAIITMVMPAPTISMIVICPSRLPTFAGERKRSLAICIATIRIVSTPSAWIRLYERFKLASQRDAPSEFAGVGVEIVVTRPTPVSRHRPKPAEWFRAVRDRLKARRRPRRETSRARGRTTARVRRVRS